MDGKRETVRLLDLFCGAGVIADGYAGHFDTIRGLDIEPQPDYPFEFVECDALRFLDRHAFLGWHYDAYHASPPCQAHTRAGHLRTAQGGESKYADMLTPTLVLIRRCPKPWVVENVPGAPFNPQPGETLLMLCGSMFGLGVQRHRLFLSNVPLVAPGPCRHNTFEPDPITGRPRPWGVYHVPGDSIPKGGRTARDAEHGRQLMGVKRSISWQGLKEGVPPAYGEWIGRQLVAHIAERAA